MLSVTARLCYCVPDPTIPLIILYFRKRWWRKRADFQFWDSTGNAYLEAPWVPCKSDFYKSRSLHFRQQEEVKIKISWIILKFAGPLKITNSEIVE